MKVTSLKEKAASEKGVTVLEYCALAAVVLVTVWGAIKVMGTNQAEMVNSVGTWSHDRAQEISSH